MGALLLLAVLAAPPATQPAAPAADQTANVEEDDKRVVPLSTVLLALRREGNKTWHREHKFAREQLDFAEERGWALDRAELIKALAKPQARNRGLDAYVRWQLLSFEPDLSGLAPSDYKVLIHAMPKITQRPGPAVVGRAPGAGSAFGGGRAFGGGGADPTLSVAQEGAVLDAQAVVSHDRRYVTGNIRATNADIVEIRRVPVAALAEDEAAVRFRDDFIAMLPADNGVRLIARFEDVADRLNRGHPSLADAADVLAAEAEAAEEAASLPGPLREQLYGWARKLVDAKTPIYTERPIEGTLEAELEIDWVMLPEAALNRLLAALNPPGEPDPVVKTVRESE